MFDKDMPVYYAQRVWGSVLRFGDDAVNSNFHGLVYFVTVCIPGCLSVPVFLFVCRPLRSRDFCCGLVSAKVLNKFWFLNDSYSDAFPTARTLFQIYYCYPTDRWMIGFLYFDRSWVNWPFGPCLLQFFQLFVNLRLLNAQLLRNLDSLGSFASCWTIFRSLDL